MMKKVEICGVELIKHPGHDPEAFKHSTINKYFKDPPNENNLRKVISREEWGAVPATHEEVLQHPVPFVLFTITETPPCYTEEECILAVQKLQKEHMERGLPDIRFNFLVGNDLNVYECRGWDVQPTIEDECYNSKEGRILEIAVLGDLDNEENHPTVQVLDVRDALIQRGFRLKYIDIGFFRQPK